MQSELPLTCKTAELLTPSANKANYYQSALYEGVANEAEAEIIKRSIRFVTDIIDGHRDPPEHGAGEEETRFELLQAFGALISRLCYLHPMSETLLSTSREVAKAMQGMDSSQRHKALDAALCSAKTDDPLTWAPLLDAVANVGCVSEIPVDVRAKCDNIFCEGLLKFQHKSHASSSELLNVLKKLAGCLPDEDQDSGKVLVTIVTAMEALREDYKFFTQPETDRNALVQEATFGCKSDACIRLIVSVIGMLKKNVLPMRHRTFAENLLRQATEAKLTMSTLGEAFTKAKAATIMDVIEGLNSVTMENEFCKAVADAEKNGYVWPRFGECVEPTAETFDHVGAEKKCEALEKARARTHHLYQRQHQRRYHHALFPTPLSTRCVPRTSATDLPSSSNLPSVAVSIMRLLLRAEAPSARPPQLHKHTTTANEG